MAPRMPSALRLALLLLHSYASVTAAAISVPRSSFLPVERRQYQGEIPNEKQEAH